jgi:hypothetical protein
VGRGHFFVQFCNELQRILGDPGHDTKSKKFTIIFVSYGNKYNFDEWKLYLCSERMQAEKDYRELGYIVTLLYMDSSTVFFYVFIVFVVVIIVRMYQRSDAANLTCVISGIDGNKYCVRDRSKLSEAADLLAMVSNKCTKMVEYMKNKYPEDSRCIYLSNNYNPSRFIETLPTSELKAYSENKGEKIAFCLNKKNTNNNELIDINTLTFVALHELSHLMTESIGHNQDFWQNFKFLLTNAKEAGIYEPVDYKNNPKEYCSMSITDNPYFDL